MDEKRDRIVREDLGFNTLPRLKEWIGFQPTNYDLGRANDGRIMDYYSFGSGADLESATKVFSIDEYSEVVLFAIELNRMRLDALCAIEGRDIAFVSFRDFSGGSISKIFNVLEYAQSV